MKQPTDEQIDIALALLEAGFDAMGLCLVCSFEDDGPIEPDTRERKCRHCGEHAVFGLEEIMLCAG